MSTGFWLLDHPNANGPFFHTSRITCKHGITPDKLPHLIVVHTAESLPDYTDLDTSGESLAKYATTTARSVSWHSTVDSDSTIPMIPDTYVGAHVINYNRCSVGMELATQAHRWVELSIAAPEWYANIMSNAANQVAWWCKSYNISAVRLTKAQVDGGARGIISHAALDPTRRSDPGADFAWDRFISDVASRLAAPDGYLDRDNWPIWAAASIQKTIDKNLMVGDGKFWYPDRPISRAEYALLLDRLGLLD